MSRLQLGLSVLFLTAATSALAAGPKATSELRDDDGKRHTAALAFDGLLSTGWAEGDEGDGEGAKLSLSFPRATEVSSISIWPGNLSQGQRSLKEYGAPALVTVTLTVADPGEDGPPSRQVRIPDVRVAGPQRVDVPISGLATEVTIELTNVNGGRVYNHTFIAEVGVNFAKGESPAAVAETLAWAADDKNERSRERHKEAVVELFDAYRAAEEGDREALLTLVDQAGDGAPWLRSRVSTRVPDGYRMQALPPDEVSIDALLKLKDPNGIPGLQLAALRSTGKREAELASKAHYFEAYQELIGGPSPSQPWGSEGWGEGGLQTFGEPLQVQIDRYGEVLAADVGNNRVQRFGTDGRIRKAYGGAEPEIASSWIGSDRPWYVSGAAAGTKPGQFSTPLDVALIPGKEADGFAVLDAQRRVQVFDSEGRVLREWTLRTETPIEGGLGGQAYLVYAKKNLVAVWDNEVFVYDLAGEEKATFELERGVPSALEALKNGKLVALYGDEIEMISLDGFHHGNQAAGTLPEGFEAADMALDEKGRLWLLTDTGVLIKYKKPGKVEAQLQLEKSQLNQPRIAVREGLVVLGENNKLITIDAADLILKQEAASE